MNLNEYQAKRLFSQHGVPIPKGKVATTPTEARDIARELGGKVVIKALVLTGGRGKAGGVKLHSLVLRWDSTLKRPIKRHPANLPKYVWQPTNPHDGH